MREYIAKIRRSKGVKTVKPRVSARFEIAAVTAKMDGGEAVLFEAVGDGGFRVVTNLVGTKKRFAEAVGASETGIHERVMSAIQKGRRPKTVAAGRFMENSCRDLARLPIVTHFEKEPGPFITSSIIHAKNFDTGRQNSSFHRMMPISATQMSVRMVEGRHLHRCFVDAKKHKEDLKVAVTVGVHPAISIAGAYQADWGKSEMAIANALLDGRLTVYRLPYSKMAVPAGAEVVMEGRILHDQTHPEFMVEMLQTYDHRRLQPVFELERLHYRNRPIFHDILSGHSEHRLLMGMPIESKINGELRKAFPAVRRVSMTDGGCNWLHAAVQISKKGDSEPAEIIARTFEAHRSLKQVVVVDEDINPDDASSIEYAMATRFQADQDLTVLEKKRGSSLDPSSDQRLLRTTKMGIDATRPLSKRPEGFEIARIPGLDNLRMAKYFQA